MSVYILIMCSFTLQGKKRGLGLGAQAGAPTSTAGLGSDRLNDQPTKQKEEAVQVKEGQRLLELFVWKPVQGSDAARLTGAFTNLLWDKWKGRRNVSEKKKEIKTKTLGMKNDLNLQCNISISL